MAQGRDKYGIIVYCSHCNGSCGRKYQCEINKRKSPFFCLDCTNDYGCAECSFWTNNHIKEFILFNINIDIDGAACYRSRIVENYFSRRKSFLEADFSEFKGVIYLNPPYKECCGQLKTWVLKVLDIVEQNPDITIVFLSIIVCGKWFNELSQKSFFEVRFENKILFNLFEQPGIYLPFCHKLFLIGKEVYHRFPNSISNKTLKKKEYQQ